MQDFVCTLGVPPPGPPPAAPHPDQPDWLPLHHTGCGHREVHLNIKVITGLEASKVSACVRIVQDIDSTPSFQHWLWP